MNTIKTIRDGKEEIATVIEADVLRGVLIVEYADGERDCLTRDEILGGSN